MHVTKEGYQMSEQNDWESLLARAPDLSEEEAERWSELEAEMPSVASTLWTLGNVTYTREQYYAGRCDMAARAFAPVPLPPTDEEWAAIVAGGEKARLAGEKTLVDPYADPVNLEIDTLMELRRELPKQRARNLAREMIAREQLSKSGAENEWLVLPLEDFDDSPLLPVVGKREDGQAAFYAGKLNAVFGESESGKTWLALIAMVQVIRAGGNAVMIDFEDSGHSIRTRLRTLGLTKEEECRFRYINPATAPSEEQKAALAEILVDVEIALIDATSEALAAYGLNSNSDTDVAKFYAELPKWIARQGPAVVLIDHVPKSVDNRNGQTGSQHKRSGVDGCSLYVERKEAFAEGRGRSHVWVNKDKHAGVRNASTEEGMWAELTNDFSGFRLQDPTDGPTYEEKAYAKAEAAKVKILAKVKEVGALDSMNKARPILRGAGIAGTDNALNELMGSLISEGCLTKKIEYVKDYSILSLTDASTGASTT